MRKRAVIGVAALVSVSLGLQWIGLTPFGRENAPGLFFGDEFVSIPSNSPAISTYGCRRTYTFVFNPLFGFGSEYNNFLFCALYAVQQNRTLVVSGNRWNYGNYFDVFARTTERCENLPGKRRAHHDPLIDNRYPHVWAERGWEGMREYHAKEKGFTVWDIRRLASFLWEPRPEIRRRMDDLIPSIEGPYYGIHLRRGDKSTEHPLIGVELYLKKVEALGRLDGNPNFTLFVASDSPSAIDEVVQARPSWRVSHIPRNFSESSGHKQTHFNGLPLGERLQEAAHFLAEVEVLRGAGRVVCTFSSNVCTLVQVLRHQDPDSLFSLDDQMFLYDFLPEGFHKKN